MKRLLHPWEWGLVLCGAFPMVVAAETEPQEILEPASVQVPSVAAVDSSWIEMFGVRLSTASRDLMRQALKTHGLKPIREDARYWVDVYDAKGLIPGASQFYIGYTAANQKLAFAEYAFPSFMDSRHMLQILTKVTAKYGQPHETVGDLSMGAYTARWRMTEGLLIEVVREWPETSTYLKFTNPAVDRDMKAELEQELSARDKTKLAEGASAPAR